MSKNSSTERKFIDVVADFASDPDTASQPDKPVIMLKRIGSTTYRVAVHFSSGTKETAGDKIARLIRNEADKVVS